MVAPDVASSSCIANTAFTDQPSAGARGDVVGVFDSGIGGLSVLRELRAQLPFAAMHYVADSAYAPYGERGDGYVADRSLRIARHLVAQGASVIVVACNTATAAAVQTLRSTWPRLAVVGVEPGLKPAVAASRNGRIGVLATPGTLASEKFRKLAAAQTDVAHMVLQPCPGLAALIERGNFESTEIRDAVRGFCRPLVEAGVDTVVLGCTHYAFVRAVIERELGPAVRLIDTAEAVARRATHLYSGLSAAHRKEAGSLRVETTGNPDDLLQVVAAMCGEPTEVHHVPLGTVSRAG